MVSNHTLGIILIIVGLIILIKALACIAIPVFRLLCGCLFLYYGINLITRINVHTPSTSQKEAVYLGSAIITVLGGEPIKEEYNTILGSLKLIFDKNIIITEPQYIKIRTILGSTELSIPNNITAKIHISSILGSTLVNDTRVAFGEKTVIIGPKNSNPTLIIDIDTILGSCIIKNSL